MDWTLIMEVVQKNKGRITGIALGLVFGWFAITHGIFKAVFVSLCIVAGYYIGRQIDRQVDWKDYFFGRFKER